jgi:hypothetical protein
MNLGVKDRVRETKVAEKSKDYYLPRLHMQGILVKE